MRFKTLALRKPPGKSQQPVFLKVQDFRPIGKAEIMECQVPVLLPDFYTMAKFTGFYFREQELIKLLNTECELVTVEVEVVK